MTIMDVAAKSDAELENIAANHKRRRMPNADLCMRARGELERRHGHGLTFEKSFDLIMAVAREERCISYKNLADASGAMWSKVHYSIGNHLYRLVDYGRSLGWPMLSAIVVNAGRVEQGGMEPGALKGFITLASELGLFKGGDEIALLKQQQQAVFAYAKEKDQA